MDYSIKDLVDRYLALPPEKQVVLGAKLKEMGLAHLLKAQPLPRSRSTNVFPVSLDQEYLWIFDQLNRESVVHNMCRAYYVDEFFTEATLEKSLNEIIRRHEILRTTFTYRDGQARQIIHPYTHRILPLVDLRSIEVSVQEYEARRLADEEASRPFHLERGPLFRFILLRLGMQDVLVLNLHHIVTDWWSYGLIEKELSALYNAFLAGGPSPLPELPLQYADYALWQREWLQSELIEVQLDYWKRQLDGAPTAIDLPSDRPRPMVQTFSGGWEHLRFPKSLLEALKALSQREGVSLFMMLFAAYEILLYRYTGQTDMVIGTPTANRDRPRTDNLIGYFLNLLLVRANLSDDASFLELLRQVRKTVLEAQAHQDLPFGKLVQELQPRRNLRRNPLFNVLFIFLVDQSTERKLPGLNDASKIFNNTVEFDLTLAVWEDANGIGGRFEYNGDLFDNDTIRRIIENYHTLLEGIVASPDSHISDLPLLASVERERVLWGCNAVGNSYPQAQCAHELFEVQVERTPDSVAVRSFIGGEGKAEELTYRELNVRANHMAHHLRGLGIGPEICVGIFVERSVEMVVGVLGILKAGGAYVPLDPTYPKERLAFMIQDAQVRVLVTQQRLLDRLPQNEMQTVCLDANKAVMGEGQDKNPISGVTGQNLAYVIYTSGSTGTPKGVSITHRNVTRLFAATEQRFHFDEHDVWTLFHSYAFDFSVWEIWGALLYGGRLVIPPLTVTRSSEEFYKLLTTERVTVLNQTPSAFYQLMQVDGHLPQTHSLALRLVIFGGEALDLHSLKPWFERHGDQCPQLVNMYGITETTVHVTYRSLTSADLLVPRNVIGRPIPDLQVYVLDRRMQPVPIGVPGELYIGGDGLARSYLSRPDLTAERFVPNVFSYTPGTRLYRTGDVVRFLSNGDLEYVGRVDRQVKIRGFRIELGEIEGALRGHPDVQAMVVIAREGESDYKYLVGYCVPKSGRMPTVSKLRAFLGHTLPEYMIPATFIILERIPLNANGKVDYAALPDPKWLLRETGEDYVPPRTTQEALLANTWAETLGIKRVGMRDNFFELGGDSLLSMQIVAKARQFGLHITPSHLYQHQTIAELAASVDRDGGVPVEQGVVSGSVPLTPMQHMFFEQSLPVDRSRWTTAVLLKVFQPIHLSLLKQAIQHIYTHHDALRLSFEETAAGWHQYYAEADRAVPFLEIDLSTVSRSRAEQLAAVREVADDLIGDMNLSQAPLIRVALCSLGPREPSWLLILSHHLLIDGTSWSILLEDLHTAYQQLLLDSVVHLPLKTTSFKQWATQLVAYAHSDPLLQELDYWEILSSDSWFPIDHAKGNNSYKTEENVWMTLPSEETNLLLQQVSSLYGAQVFEILLTALVQICTVWTGSSQLSVDLVGHGRENIFEGVDLSRTVGLLSTQFPVSLHLNKGLNSNEAVKSIQNQLRQIPQKGIGYGLLRYLSGRIESERLRQMQQPKISFNYIGRVKQFLPDPSLFEFMEEFSGLDTRVEGNRGHLINIDVSITDNCLTMRWRFSQNVYVRTTIEAVAQNFIEALRTLLSA